MVSHSPPRAALRRLLDGVRDDIEGFFFAVQPPDLPHPGLHTYQLHTGGGQHRIHLRVEGDGSGVLFVDVTDVIHLNRSAVYMAWLALEEVPLDRACIAVQRRFSGGNGDQISTELTRIYGIVSNLRDPSQSCPTCALMDVQRTPVFSTRVHAPYKVDLALTYGCNNACPHCYNEPLRYDMPSLAKGEWFQVIDRLNELGVPHLILTGGEPTQHPDLPEIIHYADQKGHIVGMNTNGRRLAHQKYLDELVDAGLNHVQVTLGSCYPEIHDAMMGTRSFHQTVQGIRNALGTRMHVITNTTLMRLNMGHVDELIEFLSDLGIRTFAMNGMIYSGGGFANPDAIPEGEIPPLMIRVREKAQEQGLRFLWYTPTEYCRMSPVELEIGIKRCNAAEYSICIEPNGDVLPCQSYYVPAGNILRDPWEQIWESKLFRGFRNREVDPAGAGLPEKCWTCIDLSLCGGGCRIEREARLGQRVAILEDEKRVAPGCAGACGTGRVTRPHPQKVANSPGGYIPPPGTAQAGRRGAGMMPPVIPYHLPD